MAFTKAERRSTFLKVGLFGPSGSGKSYSALKLASGIAKVTGSRIAVINTERNRGEIYADTFDYDMMELEAPYSPEKYMAAIDDAINGGYKVLVIDSTSHEWIGEGGILDTKSKMTGNDFANWNKLTPRHDAFIEKITSSPIHTIVTMRGKDEYVLEEKNGKNIPRKVGMGTKQRDGFEYEFHVAWMINMDHFAEISKDIDGMFSDTLHQLSEADGEKLAKWATGGKAKPVSRVTPDAKPAPLEKMDVQPNDVAGRLSDLINRYQTQMSEAGVKYAMDVLDEGDIVKMKAVISKIEDKYELLEVV